MDFITNLFWRIEFRPNQIRMIFHRNIAIWRSFAMLNFKSLIFSDYAVISPRRIWCLRTKLRENQKNPLLIKTMFFPLCSRSAILNLQILNFGQVIFIIIHYDSVYQISSFFTAAITIFILAAVRHLGFVMKT